MGSGWERVCSEEGWELRRFLFGLNLVASRCSAPPGVAVPPRLGISRCVAVAEKERRRGRAKARPYKQSQERLCHTAAIAVGSAGTALLCPYKAGKDPLGASLGAISILCLC
jgi:hypothetical protein